MPSSTVAVETWESDTSADTIDINPSDPTELLLTVGWGKMTIYYTKRLEYDNPAEPPIPATLTIDSPAAETFVIDPTQMAVLIGLYPGLAE